MPKSSFPPQQTAEYPAQETADAIKARFAHGIPEGEGRDQRLNWAGQLADLMVRIKDLRHRRARNRNIAHLGARLAAGVTAVVAAATGSTLVTGATGPAAAALGVTTVVLGVVGGALAAMRPSESYATDLVIAAQYERLWWDMYQFGNNELRTVSQATFAATWNTFNERLEAINSVIGPGSTQNG
jgi:hypothetical protein